MNKKIILTGAMGSGKSSILKLLRLDGFSVVEEPAREILAEQRSIKSDGVPEKNSELFTKLLLSRAIYQFKQSQTQTGIVFFDRGIPDIIAYAQLFNLNDESFYLAAKLYSYHTKVFIFPSWKEIYTTDDERKISFEGASEFGDNLRKIYSDCGYQLIEVPCISPEERVAFIKKKI